MQARDPRRFLEHLAAFGWLGGNHLRDLALADQRGRMRAGGGIGEGQRDILGAHVLPVDAVGAARAALDPADDLQLLAVARPAVQHHLGEVARRARLGAREDDILHPARPHRFG